LHIPARVFVAAPAPESLYEDKDEFSQIPPAEWDFWDCPLPVRGESARIGLSGPGRFPPQPAQLPL